MKKINSFINPFLLCVSLNLTSVAWSNEELSADQFKLAEETKTLVENKIARLEGGAEDVYSQELSQPYLELGYALRTLEQHEAAAEAFDRAFQVVRISDGLYSEQQLPILREVLQSNKDDSDWYAVEESYHLATQISQRAYEISDERRQNAVLEFASWKLQALADNLIPRRSGLLAIESEELYRHELNRLRQTEDYPGKNKYLAALFLGLASSQSYLVKDIANKSLDQFLSMEPRDTVRRVCRSVVLPDGTLARMCNDEKIENPNYLLGQGLQKKQAVITQLSMMRASLESAIRILEQEEMKIEENRKLYEQASELSKVFDELAKEI